MNSVPRRDFLRRAAAAGAVYATLPTSALPATAKDDAWSFALLGDTHFDKLEHHDLAWLAQEHPGDVEQVKRYSAHAASLLPELFAVLKGKIAAAKKTVGEGATPIE